MDNHVFRDGGRFRNGHAVRFQSFDVEFYRFIHVFFRFRNGPAGGSLLLQLKTTHLVPGIKRLTKPMNGKIGRKNRKVLGKYRDGILDEYGTARKPV